MKAQSKGHNENDEYKDKAKKGVQDIKKHDYVNSWKKIKKFKNWN